jgi:signal peptidase I
MKNKPFRPLPLILFVFLFAVVLRCFFLDAALVKGRSMLPTLAPGSVVLICKAAYGLGKPGGGYALSWRQPIEGEIVAAHNPRDGSPVIKRVAPWPDSAASLGYREEGSVYLIGDNDTESLDSRSYGPVPVESVWGRVILFRPWPAP